MRINHVEWPLMVAGLLPWASVAACALFTPRLTRPDLFFAVTVSPSFRQSPSGREILRRYYGSVAIVSLIASVLIVLVNSQSPPLRLTGLLGPVLVELLGWFAVFLVARHLTMPYHVEPSAQREAQLQPRPVSLPGGWLAQAGPFLILGAVCLCLGLRWNSIPARIPIHWGVGGRPDGWATKSPAAVFGGTAIGVLVCVLLAVLWYAVVRNVRRIHGSGPRKLSETRFIRAISHFILAMEYWLALLMGLLSLTALRTNVAAPLPAFWPILLGQTLFVVTIFVIAVRAGQGGWRWGLTAEGGVLPADTAPVGDRTPDAYWRLGVFYFNRDDSALFVEKRFGVGWTLNFGNPRSWFVIGGILLFLLAVIGLSLFMMKASH